jgi:hypothetical protein
VKLVVAEPESDALRSALVRWRAFASSTVLRADAVRALRRPGNGRLVPQARRLFRSLHLIRVDEPLLDRAGELEPADLRPLEPSTSRPR